MKKTILLIGLLLMASIACRGVDIEEQEAPSVPYPAFVITMPANGDMTSDTPSENLSVLHSGGAFLDFVVNSIPNGSHLLIIINRNREMGDVEITGYIADSDFISAYREGKYKAEDLAEPVKSNGTIIDEQAAELEKKVEEAESN